LGGSRDKDERVPKKATKGYKKEGNPSWKTQRRMVRCSGQGREEDVEMQELETVGGG